MAQPRYSCALDGQCEVDEHGRYPTLADCERQCQASTEKELEYVTAGYDPAIVLNYAPSDRSTFLKREYRVNVSPEQSYEVLQAVISLDPQRLVQYPILYQYARQLFTDNDRKRWLNALVNEATIPALDEYLALQPDLNLNNDEGISLMFAYAHPKGNCDVMERLVALGYDSYNRYDEYEAFISYDHSCVIEWQLDHIPNLINDDAMKLAAVNGWDTYLRVVISRNRLLPEAVNWIAASGNVELLREAIEATNRCPDLDYAALGGSEVLKYVLSECEYSVYGAVKAIAAVKYGEDYYDFDTQEPAVTEALLRRHFRLPTCATQADLDAALATDQIPLALFYMEEYHVYPPLAKVVNKNVVLFEHALPGITIGELEALVEQNEDKYIPYYVIELLLERFPTYQLSTRAIIRLLHKDGYSFANCELIRRIRPEQAREVFEAKRDLLHRIPKAKLRQCGAVKELLDLIEAVH